MAKVKRFLLYHGEKVALALIGVMCLYSIYTDLTRPAGELRLPGGRTVKIDKDKIDSKIKKIQNALKSSARNLPEVSVETGVTEMLRRQRQQADRPLKALSWEWLFYCKPPRPLDRIAMEKPNVAQDGKEPPVTFVTGLASPAEYEVHVSGGASGGKILILCQDSSLNRYPLRPFDIEVIAYVRRIAEAKENLSPEDREMLRTRKTGDSFGLFTGDAKADDEDDDDGEERPGAGWGLGLGGEERAGGDARGDAATDPDAAEQEFWVRENDNGRMLQKVMGSAPIKSKWIQIGKMRTYTEKPDPEKVFKHGLKPQGKARHKRGKHVKKINDTDTGGGFADLFGGGRKTKKTPKKTDDEDDLFPGEGTGGDAGKPKEFDWKLVAEEKYAPRWYAMLIDKGVSENVIYRFKLVARVRVRDIPKAARDHNKGQDFGQWIPFVELVNREVTRATSPAAFKKIYLATRVDGDDQVIPKSYRALAISGDAYAKMLKKEQPSILEWKGEGNSFYPVDRIRFEARRGQVTVAKNGKGRFTPFMSAAGEHNSALRSIMTSMDPTKTGDIAWFYSDPTITDIVLTPVGKRVGLKSVSKVRQRDVPQGLEPEVKLVANVYVEVIEEGIAISSKRIKIAQPLAAKKMKPTIWIKRGKDGKALWSDNTGRPEFRTLAEVYSRLKNLKAVKIGSVQKVSVGASASTKTTANDGGAQPKTTTRPKRSKKREIDFRSSWELVDVRKCILIERRFKVDPDEPTVRTEITKKPNYRDWNYIVVRETGLPEGQAPRYRRILKLPFRSVPKGQVIEREIEWYPTLREQICKQVLSRNLFKINDLRDVKKFLSKVHLAGKDPEAKTPARRLFELASEALKRRADEANRGISHTMAEKQKILAELNKILPNPNLYSSDYFNAEALPPRLQKLTRRDKLAWRDCETAEINRQLILNAFPDELGVKKVIKEDEKKAKKDAKGGHKDGHKEGA